jgi:hypothetical protein
MNDDASTVVPQELSPELTKEAVDALVALPDNERREAFDYFKSLVEFKKHAVANPSRV